MRIASLASLWAVGVSAAVLNNPSTGLEKRDCDDHAAGTFWTGPSNASPSGGCAWFYCEGSIIEEWINCGAGACTEENGVPGC